MVNPDNIQKDDMVVSNESTKTPTKASIKNKGKKASVIKKPSAAKSTTKEKVRTPPVSTKKIDGRIRKFPESMTKKSSSVEDSPQVSNCSHFILNKKNTAYLIDTVATEYMTSIKADTFTLKDLQSNVLTKLNSSSNVKYHLSQTPKYVQLKCKGCSTFMYWFRSVDGKDTSDMKEGDLLQLFRSINQNHMKSKHSDISLKSGTE